MQWIYGLFLDLIAYCANALLGVMSTDLEFFETSVPITATLYRVFVAIGWGLLIGNLAFQSMKAMFAGFGFETESPAVLLLRTFLFGTLLVFSRDICEIGLSIGKNVIDLLGIPDSVTLTMPDESFFTGGASWLLVIIIGFILGFQLIKLFFEIAERYVIVAVLTLLCPVGLSMGGSKSTKDICAGFMRTYASMIVMMVLNVLFLKLVLSALSSMPSGVLVLPWCLLVVGIVKTARKADNLISRIGMNPAVTGDPLGHGGGRFAAMMAARTIINSASKSGAAKSGGKPTGGKTMGGNKTMGGAVYSNTNTTAGGSSFNTSGTQNNSANSSSAASNRSSQQSAHTGTVGGDANTVSTSSSSSQRFGSSSIGSVNGSTQNSFGSITVGGTGSTQVNTNRFGAAGALGSSTVKPPAPGINKTPGKSDLSRQKGGIKTDRTGKQNTADKGKAPAKPAEKPNALKGAEKPRFGSADSKVKSGQSPMQKGVPGGFAAGRQQPVRKDIKAPASVQNAQPDNIKTAETDTDTKTAADGDSNE